MTMHPKSKQPHAVPNKLIEPSARPTHRECRTPEIILAWAMPKRLPGAESKPSST